MMPFRTGHSCFSQVTTIKNIQKILTENYSFCTELHSTLLEICLNFYLSHTPDTCFIEASLIFHERDSGPTSLAQTSASFVKPSVMTLQRAVAGFLLSLYLPQTVISERNCDSPNAVLHIAPVEIRDRFVQYEAVITADANPPYATSTITVPLRTLTTTRTENRTETEFFLDAGCVVSSGSSIYTLTASAAVTQNAATPVSFWVRSLYLKPKAWLWNLADSRTLNRTH